MKSLVANLNRVKLGSLTHMEATYHIGLPPNKKALGQISGTASMRVSTARCQGRKIGPYPQEIQGFVLIKNLMSLTRHSILARRKAYHTHRARAISSHHKLMRVEVFATAGENPLWSWQVIHPDGTLLATGEGAHNANEARKQACAWIDAY